MSETAKQIVQAYFDKALGGDPSFAELLAEDIEWWVPPGSPMGGTHKGKGTVLDFLGRAFGLYDVSSMKLQIERMLGEGDTVAVRFSLEAKTAKGRNWSGQYAMFFEVADGKIRSVREFADTKRLEEVVFA